MSIGFLEYLVGPTVVIMPSIKRGRLDSDEEEEEEGSAAKQVRRLEKTWDRDREAERADTDHVPVSSISDIFESDSDRSIQSVSLLADLNIDIPCVSYDIDKANSDSELGSGGSVQSVNLLENMSGSRDGGSLGSNTSISDVPYLIYTFTKTIFDGDRLSRTLNRVRCIRTRTGLTWTGASQRRTTELGGNDHEVNDDYETEATPEQLQKIILTIGKYQEEILKLQSQLSPH